MGRCWGCCQENCGYSYCSCSCHADDRREAERLEARAKLKKEEPVKKASTIKRRNAGLPIDKGYTLETVLESMNQLLVSHGLEVVIVAEAGETIYVTVERVPEDLHTR